MNSSDGVDQTEIVQVSYVADLDRDELEEFVEEEHPDADFVEVQCRTTADYLAGRGSRPGYICPECGEEAYGIRSSGGEHVYSHGLDDQCVVRDDGWEPPRGHPEEDVSLGTRLMRAFPFALSVSIVLGIAWFVMTLMPRASMTVNGETVVVPPTGPSMWGVFAIITLGIFVVYAIPHLPGMVKSGGLTR